MLLQGAVRQKSSPQVLSLTQKTRVSIGHALAQTCDQLISANPVM